jgi:DNA-binding MarR family transcriptional regulator
VPTLDVSERMIEQAPGVTRLMDPLEGKGLIRRQRCPPDRRQHLCWSTPQGPALLDQIDAATSRAHEDSL